ncbi:hypothetical protein J7E87_00380 [Streptomyces sp. ISL-1]|uniref:hypothetical protein n=1 Tax=Streptomyces sp. ISL-1 TaxID=2817657 RepID=UPI001BE5407A|nr:hypothetical protein [Streptomyces sp. ISL-1]MBT2387913.1 hypothetical protein [Streptomyces sp. ISL-1]
MGTQRRSARAVSVPALALALALASALTAGCQQATGRVTTAGAGSGSLTATPSGYGPVFLGPGDCGSRGRDVQEVPCTSEKATARVIARYEGRYAGRYEGLGEGQGEGVGEGQGEGRPASGPGCPAATDFVLHISESRPADDEDGDGEVGRGYACMRNLEPPHPGDPGGGGGPLTVVGDCVYNAGKGQVKETACDGSGPRAPEFEVASAVRSRAQCPPSTALYVRLGGESPVGCARRP